MIAGAHKPGIDPQLLGQFQLRTYAFAYFAIVLPNLLFVAALLVMLAALSRSLLVVYVGVLAFVALWAAANFLGAAPAAGLLDPFGIRAVAQATRYLTGPQRNASLPTLSGALLANRLLWSGAALVMLAATVLLFRPVRAGTGSGWRMRRTASATVPAARVKAPALRRIVPQPGRAAWAQCWNLLCFDARGVLRSLPFIVMVLLALANFLANYTVGGLRIDSTPYPLTRLMLEELNDGINAMLMIVLLFYSGELVHKSRQARIDGLTLALPVPGWVPLVARFGTLVMVIFAFLGAGVASAIGVQLAVGGAPIEPLLYLKGTLVNATGFILMAAALLTIHAVCANKFGGYGLGIALLASGSVLQGAGLEQNLYRFAALPPLPYSDLNGYGHYFAAWGWHALYWACGAAAALVVGLCFSPRYVGAGLHARVRAAAASLRGAHGAALVLCLAAFAGCGAWIWKNTHVWNHYQSAAARLDERADYERTYRNLLQLPQPRLAAINVAIDLYPESQALDMHGRYTLANDSGAPIDNLYVQKDLAAQTALANLPPHVAVNDARHGMLRIRLLQPLAPGASMPLDFTVQVRRKGFSDDNAPGHINENGTFFTIEDFFPKFGYNPSREVSDKDERKAHGLGPSHALPPLGEPAGARQNYLKTIGIDAGRAQFEAIISTSAGQTAIAPGDLLCQWQAGGRSFYHYRMGRPALPFISIQSGRFEVRRTQWHDVAIEVYFDAKHAYNIDSMIAGAKAALEYNSAQFGPYPDKVLRLVETPLYLSAARSFPTVIPFSESLGFVSDLRDRGKLDHVFYITAHEVAHTWWGDQAIAANMEGNLLITESLAEYSALMATRQRFGDAALAHLLDFDLDRYLTGRASDRNREPALGHTTDQTYLAYRKASLVFWRLRAELGEEAINRALRQLLARGGQAPYLTSADLVQALRTVAPADKQALLTDSFERVAPDAGGLLAKRK